MSEATATAPQKASPAAGLVKAAATSLFGLVSGAFLMYFTPLVNNAIKPPRPVANFAHQAQGLTVNFANRSTGGTQGWWDFGDGSALEPFDPKQDAVSHTYAKPGTYNVKLSLTNLFNEGSERAVAVTLESTSVPAPVIELFQVIPLSPGMPAPAVFRVVAKVKGATHLIWALGEGRSFELSPDTDGVQERWVTVNEPGFYTFRLAAIHGKQIVEKTSDSVFVSTAENNPFATVRVTYDAVHVDRKELTVKPVVEWKGPATAPSSPFVKEFSVPGYQVVKAELAPLDKDAPLKGVPAIEVAGDRTKIVVKGEMAKAPGASAPPSSYAVPVRVTIEKRGKSQTKAMEEVPMYLKVPGTTAIPLPRLSDGWQAVKQQISLELKEGARVMWSGAQMPTNAALQLKSRPVLVSATVQDGQILLKVDNHPAALRPTN